MKRIISLLAVLGLYIAWNNIANGAAGASATATVTGGAIATVNVTSGGSEYTSAPTVFIMDTGGGSDASATATVSDGAVISVTVTAGGSGYSSSTTQVIFLPNTTDLGDPPTETPSDPPSTTPDTSSLPDEPTSSPGAESRIINISTRGFVGTGDNQELVGGFVLMGEPGESKTVVIKGVSSYMSSLPEFASGGLLDDPKITVQDFFGKIVATNDNWKVVEDSSTIDSSQKSQFATSYSADQLQGSDYDIYRSELVDDNQAAMLITLPLMTNQESLELFGTEAYGGYALYTAIVSSASGSSGVAQVAIEDTDRSDGYESTAKLINISTRGYVGPDENQELVGGFVIMGEPGQQKNIVVKGVAQYMSSLPEFASGGLLDDPTLTLQDFFAKKVAVNNDWQTQQALDSGDDISTFAATYDPAILDSESYSIYRNELDGQTKAAGMLISLDVMSAEQSESLLGTAAYAGFALYTAVITSSSNNAGVAQVTIEDPDR